MAFAANLVEAANLSYAQLALKWRTDTLAAASAAFAVSAGPVFPETDQNSHPVGNWFILIDALTSTLPAVSVSETDFNQMVEYVARMCYATYTLNIQTPQLITNAQAASALAAWNAAFGS